MVQGANIKIGIVLIAAGLLAYWLIDSGLAVSYACGITSVVLLATCMTLFSILKFVVLILVAAGLIQIAYGLVAGQKRVVEVRYVPETQPKTEIIVKPEAPRAPTTEVKILPPVAGAPLKVVICPNCGHENVATARYCVNCGFELRKPEMLPGRERAPAPGPVVQAERKPTGPTTQAPAEQTKPGVSPFFKKKKLGEK